MPGLAKSPSLKLAICLLLWPLLSVAGDFAAKVRYAELVTTGNHYRVNAEIHYRLSPTALEALHKGVLLSWDVLIELRRSGYLWDSVIYRQTLPYSLQYHALLNQYSINNGKQKEEMFLSLNAALSYMALLHDAASVDKDLLQAGNFYQLAVKTRFDRERLPVPLRPLAYLDADWFLSSDWLLWSIQK